MSAQERYQRPPLRYKRFGGGYRREDVEFALAELRLTLRQLDNDLESLRDRNRELEAELQHARNEIESFRGKEHELSQTMSSALRRANEIEDGANSRAREIIAQAEEAAMRIRSEASRRIEDSSAQFNELLRLKDNLLDAMRSVVGDFDQAISRVERGEQLFPGVMQAAETAPPPPPPAPPAEEPWPKPMEATPAAEERAPAQPFVAPPEAIPEPAPAAPSPPPVAPPQPVPDTASIPAAPPPPPPEPCVAPTPPPAPYPVPAPPDPRPVSAAAPPPVSPPPAAAPPPLSPPPPPPPAAAAPPPVAPPPPPPAAPPPPAEPTEAAEVVFETRVELDAGPFSDFAALSAFERSLAHLPKVEDVYVRRLADDRALIELTLSEPAPLLQTMKESLPYQLDVRSANRSKLVVNVTAQTTAATR